MKHLLSITSTINIWLQKTLTMLFGTTINQSDNKPLKYFTLVLITLIQISRAPQLFTNPRLWAEEGTRYLNNAMFGDFWRGVFFLPKYTAGYFNLISSIPCTLAAAIFPLEHIPLFLTSFSLFCFVITVWRILFIPNIYIKTIVQKVLLSFVLVFFISESGTAEALLNTINIQVYCGIYGLLILTTPNSYYNIKKTWVDIFTLLLLALSGPYVIFIGLAYFLRLFLYPSKPTKYLFFAITIGAVIQLLSYVYLNINDYLSAKKTAPVHWEYITTGINKFFILDPILSERLAHEVFNNRFLYYTTQNIIDQDRLYLQGILGLIVILSLLTLYYFSLSKKSFLMLATTLLPVCFLTTLFAMNFVPGGRYSVFPTFIMGFFLISILSEETKTSLKIITCLLIFSGIFINISDFWTYRKHYFGGTHEVPNWKNEVEKFNSQKGNHVFIIWPFPKWEARLPYIPSLKLLNSKFKEISSQETPNIIEIDLAENITLPKFNIRLRFKQPIENQKVKLTFFKDEQIVYEDVQSKNKDVLFEDIFPGKRSNKILTFNKIVLKQESSKKASQIDEMIILSPYNSF